MSPVSPAFSLSQYYKFSVQWFQFGDGAELRLFSGLGLTQRAESTQPLAPTSARHSPWTGGCRGFPGSSINEYPPGIAHREASKDPDKILTLCS